MYPSGKYKITGRRTGLFIPTMSTPRRSTLTTLPVELVLSVMDHLDNWYDIHNLMRAYQGLENSNTTRRLQKLMFRADARKLKQRLDSGYGGYPLLQSTPPITAGCWAILMGDVELALSALDEYRVQGSEDYLYATRDSTEGHLHCTGCQESEGDEQFRGPSRFNKWAEVLHLSKPCTNYMVTALGLAAWQGRKDMVKVLIDKGARIRWRHPDGGYPTSEVIVVAALSDWGLDLDEQKGMKMKEEEWMDVEEPWDTEPITADVVINGEELDNNGDEMADNLRQPDEEKLQMEAALFKTMMEEGAKQPVKPSQLRWALETALEGYSIRALNRHPRVILHFVKMLNYLVERGATFEKLHRNSVKIVAT
ncbi:predicted protein [Chaetomium globosum CBS 148.51]|uniref:Uncharacterized protein n=1 Tax=Chaetomium globosum (strain ATCC 6205 / CBS 148.51 / DSM 1962 / NBRC 6347 / NRRL 1970) TaxID=306901 RepID=Q2H5N4_CHAGB|nr:uncharacterized protein CHGG_06031 [Chaetomium globosum CBS 148.51]EAQ89412.1 predicted protein [Chaetomium globosum CBS 148.51]